jgi:dihydroorotate dehydrogenase electron transfer subunit
MPVDLPALVVAHDAVNPEHFLLTLEAPPIARRARPGQFVMLQTRAGYEPLLRRPMSVCRVSGGRRNRIDILYKVVGEGTRYLSERRPGTRLAVLGPLGNGFPPPARGRRPVLVAGGIGVAIFPFLADDLERRGARPLLLFGARRRRDLVGLDLFRARRVPIRLATEDGSAGARGFVTGLLEPLLDVGAAGRRAGTARDAAPPEIYACGPTPMLRAVGDLAVRAGVPCHLALESHMPCGIGVCLGCVVRCPADAAGPVYRRVCTEGPVFEAGAVLP